MNNKNNEKLKAILINPEDLEQENEKLIKGKIVKVKEFAIRNDVGGTTLIKKEDIGQDIEVEITESWYDYETGEGARAKLIDKNVIEKTRELGESKYTPEDYKKYGEEMYRETVEAKQNYDPTTVSISEWDLEI